jgi:hypothetical protein
MSLREEIIKQVGIIPMSVRTGSVQMAIRFKECANDALRVVNNPKAGDRELRQALASLKRYN